MTIPTDLQAAAGLPDSRPVPHEQRVREAYAHFAVDPENLRNDTRSLLTALLHLCTAHGWDAAELVAGPKPETSVLVPAVAAARKLAVYTGSFDPPTRFHRSVAEQLRAEGFAEVVIRPDGPRADRAGTEQAAPIHRAVMTDLAFRGLPGVVVDLSDLDRRAFTPHLELEREYAGRGEVWHVVSDEFVTHGRHGHSIVHTRWDHGPRMWANSRFAVYHPAGSPPDPADCPPTYRLFAADGNIPTADLRAMIFTGGADAAEGFVPPPVAGYIRRHGLFTGEASHREVRTQFRHPRVKIFTGPQAEAHEIAGRFRHLESNDPNLILVLGGDGTMLRAIREHWRERIPFLGLNAGHLGHLMNERLPDTLAGADLILFRMPMLRVDTVSDDGVAAQSLAFNDAWVERDGGQGAWLRLDVNGHPRISKVVADGLLVATPSGSSAYARAMGATPVPLNSPVITLAGSNVFRPQFWKPLALPDDAVVRMTSVGDPLKRPIRCFIDGTGVGRVRSMECRVSPVAAVEVAFTPEFDLPTKLLRSLFPPDDGAV